MIELASTSVEEFKNSLAHLGGRETSADRIYRVEAPERMGQGFWEIAVLQPGLEVGITNLTLKHEVSWSFPFDRPLYAFDALLDGSYALEARDTPWSVTASKGTGGVLHADRGRFMCRLPSERYVSLSAHVTPDWFHTRQDVWEQFQSTPLPLCPCGCPLELFSRKQLSSVTVAVCRDMIGGALYNPLYLLALESCVLRLIAEQLSVLRSSRPVPHAVNRNTREKMHAVRELLIASPEQSPRLTDLARMVETNEFSLKQNFRRVFGTTVYGFLRRYRMELADEMLRRGEHKVGEVAQCLGYVSAGRFAEAFRKEFGVSPKLRQRCRH